MVNNRVYCRNNRQFYTVLLRQLHGSKQGIDALDDHTDFLNSFIRLFSLTNQVTSSVVAAVYTGCSHNKVAHTGKPCKGLIHTAHRHAQPSDFRHAASNQGSFHIVAITQTGRNATRQRNDVLQRAAQLHTFYINVRIHTHTGVRENILNFLCDFEVCASRNNQRGHIQSDFFRMSGSRKSYQLDILMRSVFLKLVLDNLAQCQQRIRFNSFAYIYDDLVIRNVGRSRACGRPNKNRRHCKNNDFPVHTGFFDAFSESNLLGDHHTRQVRMNACGR